MGTDKTATSLMLLARKLRKGTRPFRVSTFLAKHGSEAGQDMRLPVMGGTKFPTLDSKSFATKQLEQSKNSAEAGPTPSMQKLQATGPKVADLVPQTGGRNIMPKFASLSEYDGDPLIQYLKMENESFTLPSNYSYDKEGPSRTKPTTGKPEQSEVCPCGRFETNQKDEMRTGPEEYAYTSDSPQMDSGEDSEIRSDLRDYLKDKFTADKGFRKKGKEKDHPYGEGSESVVDRILNS